jgi:hypothetical protein
MRASARGRDDFTEEQKATFRAWIEGKDDADASKAASAELLKRTG